MLLKQASTQTFKNSKTSRQSPIEKRARAAESVSSWYADNRNEKTGLQRRTREIILFNLWRMSAHKAKLLPAKAQHFSKNTEPSEQKSVHSDQQRERPNKNPPEMREFIQFFKEFINNAKKSSLQVQKCRKLEVAKEMEPRDRQIVIDLPEQPNSQLTLQSLQNFNSELCRVVWSRAFYYYSTNQLSLEHSKIYSSEQILKNLVRLSEKHRLTARHFEIINNHLQRKLLDYMLNKYPMTLSQEVNRTVNTSIREIDNTDQLTNDYVYNSPVAFKFRETGEYNDLIMKTINEVQKKIECKIGNRSVYQKFQDKMERLFENIKDINWMNDLEDLDRDFRLSPNFIGGKNKIKRTCSRTELEMKREVELMKHDELEKYRLKVEQYTSYKIGRKLPESTRPFSEEEINSHNIKISNSQTLRLLTKWCEQLQRKFTTPNYFSHYIETLKLENGKYVAEVPDDIKEYLDQLMVEEYKSIKHELIQLANNNYYLQSELLLNELSKPIVSQIQKYECITSRYSIDMVHNLHSYIITYLNRLIHGLLSVAQKFSKNKSVRLNQWSSSLNLVTFQVMDLLRCKCASGEKEVLKIYNQLIKMSESQSIKIVRVINRLKKGTNDILINIKYRQVLCEIQLSVTSKRDKFIEYSNLFNHYLYELKRSYFGPLTQLCSIWTTLDSRFIYYYKIKGLSEQKSKQKQHSCKSEREFQFFDRPFICSECSNHYYHNNYIRHHIKCKKCLFWLCAKCQIASMDAKTLISAAFKNDEIIKNCVQITSKNQSIPEFGVCVFIESQQLKVQPFRRHTNKNKTNIIGIKSRHLYEIYDISTYQHENNFRNSFIIFEISNSFGKKYIHIEDEKIKEFWIEQTLSEVFQKNKERICLNYTSLSNEILSKFSLLATPIQKSNIKKIEAIGNKIEAIDAIATQYRNVKYLQISKNSVTNFSGIERMERLEKLFINQNKLKEVPLDIVGLWNMRELSLAWNEIKVLPDQLARLHRLNILRIGNNKIQQFSSCLGQLFYLKQLCLKCNSIKEIPQCIKSLNELTSLQLQNNQVKEIHVNIGYLVNLEYLNLSFNHIEALPDTFMSLSSLTYLNLSHNKIRQLPSSVNSLFSLCQLDLSNNQISSLPLLNKLHKLTELNLNYNILSEIYQLPQGLSNIRVLSLSHNNLKQIPYIGFLDNMEELYLNNNSIDLVHQSIAKLDKLQILRLEHNNLSKICELKLQNLKTLNISQNKLTSFCNMDLICLEELDISGNFISSFLYNLLPSIKRINLANNSLSDFDTTNYTKLRYIHLSYNKFTSIPPFYERNHIKVLSLEHNLITNIPSNIYCLRNLTLLNLSHNKIELVPKEIMTIEGIKERGLDLSQNPIEKVDCWEFLMCKGTKSTIESLERTLKVGDAPDIKSEVKCHSSVSNRSIGSELYDLRETA